MSVLLGKGHLATERVLRHDDKSGEPAWLVRSLWGEFVRFQLPKGTLTPALSQREREEIWADFPAERKANGGSRVSTQP